MDPTPNLVAAILGFLAGWTLSAMLVRWAQSLGSVVASYRLAARETRSPWEILAVVLLHSAPWALAIALVAGYYVAVHPHAAWWQWALGGALAGPMMFTLLAIAGLFRRVSDFDDDTPLTPERLRQARKRFMWGTTLFFGLCMSLVMLCFAWTKIHSLQLLPFAVILLPMCLGGGYLFALVTWQWRSAQIEARDYDRKRRAMAEQQRAPGR